MTAHQLLHLYPRAWRDRYGEEFLATVGHGALRAQQIVDIVAGAIDAWLSLDVRRMTQAQQATHQLAGGSAMTGKLHAICHGTTLRYTKRDALIGAAIMMGGTIVFSAVGIYARRHAMPVTGEIVKSLAFPGSLTLSMPFVFLKGQPWKAQVVLIGGTMALLVLAGYVASLI
jgi:hypothetical protein